MPLSTATHDTLLNQIFRGAAALAVTGPIRVHLHTADPGAAGTANEVSTASWTNYAPAEILASGTTEPHFTNAADDGGGFRATENLGAVSFGTATMDVPATTVTVTHFTIKDAAGSPLYIGGNALAASRVINDGDPVSFPTGTLRVRLGPAA